MAQKITMPCGFTSTSNHLLKHLKKCDLCKQRYEAIFAPENRHRLQKVVNETDLKAEPLCKALTEEFDFPVVGRTLVYDTLKRVIQERVYPEDGDKKCICGFRTRNVGTLMHHKKECEINKQWVNDVLNELKDTENLTRYLINRNLTVLEYIQELVPEALEYHPDIYNIMLNYIRELTEQGVIDYHIKQIDELLKDERIKRKQESTVYKKYGVRNVSQNPIIKKKKEQTSIKNFGVPYHLQSESQKQKLKESVRNKHGVENVSQLNWVKEKKKQTFQDHYGVDNIFQLREIVEQGMLRKHGVPNPAYLKENMIKLVCNAQNAYKKIIYGKEFVFLSDLEELCIKYTFDQRTNGNISGKLLKVLRVNETYLYDNPTDLSADTNAWLVDIDLGSYLIEVKKLNQIRTQDIQKYTRLASKFKKNWILYCKEDSDEVAVIFKVDEEPKYLTTSWDLLERVISKFPSEFQNIKKGFLINIRKKLPVFSEILKLANRELKEA